MWMVYHRETRADSWVAETFADEQAARMRRILLMIRGRQVRMQRPIAVPAGAPLP